MIARQATYRKASIRTKTRMVNNACAVFLSKNFKCLPWRFPLYLRWPRFNQPEFKLPPPIRKPAAVHEMIYKMPELPEVETIANGLNKRVAGDRIESVWVGSKPEPLKSSAAEISSTLEGAQVERVRRVGKHIVFDLGSGKSAGDRQWIVHLGMTGQMLVANPETEAPKHTHLVAKLA